MTVSKGQSYKRARRSADPAYNTSGGHHPGLDNSALAKRVMVAALTEYLKQEDYHSTLENETALAIQLRLIRELRGE